MNHQRLLIQQPLEPSANEQPVASPSAKEEKEEPATIPENFDSAPEEGFVNPQAPRSIRELRIATAVDTVQSCIAWCRFAGYGTPRALVATTTTDCQRQQLLS